MRATLAAACTIPIAHRYRTLRANTLGTNMDEWTRAPESDLCSICVTMEFMEMSGA